MIRTKLVGLVAFVLVYVVAAYGGRYITYRQADPDDIVTKDKIDRQIDNWLEKLDRQIQADTVVLVAGASQVVQLAHKYPDTDYKIFVSCRVDDNYSADMVLTPTTDSSFTITKGNLDESTIQYMTVYK